MRVWLPTGHPAAAHAMIVGSRHAAYAPLGRRCVHFAETSARSGGSPARLPAAMSGTAIAAGTPVFVAVVLFIVAVLLLWRVTRSIRQASEAAEALADERLSVRLPESGRGGIRGFQRAFNAMADSVTANRDDLARIVAEQTALRRVATLVARGGPPAVIFDVVLIELGRLLNAEFTVLNRYWPDGTMTIAGSWSASGNTEIMPAIGSRWSMEEESAGALVWRTGRPERTDYVGAAGELAVWARSQGITCGVCCPIRVDGRLWGSTTVLSRSAMPLPGDTEERMSNFVELASTAIANAESRAQLQSSRIRIVDAGDEARRRIGRNLHDGAQQRLVTLALGLREAEAALPPGRTECRNTLIRTVRSLDAILRELQDISRGLNPVLLQRGGLGPALKSLARRSAVPIELDVHNRRRLGERTEAGVYYIVSEALTNAAKHANASRVHVRVRVGGDRMNVMIRDNGVGGADPDRGTGLVGIRDRLETLGGSIEIESPPGHGTSLRFTIPITDA